MSWYFFGGFSAYAIEPSGSCVNHSGCSRTHGWSGEPAARGRGRPPGRGSGRAHEGRKSSRVPRSGCTASCPPSADADGPREPGSSGRRRGCCCVPCGTMRPIGMDRREVEDVEAHAATPGSRCSVVGAAKAPDLRRVSGVVLSERQSPYQETLSARSRSTRTGTWASWATGRRVVGVNTVDCWVADGGEACVVQDGSEGGHSPRRAARGAAARSARSAWRIAVALSSRVDVRACVFYGVCRP